MPKPTAMSDNSPLRILSENHIQSIHHTALGLLGRVGGLIKEPRARSYFKEAGAAVDEDSVRVRIPTDIVTEAVKQPPSRFTLHARNPDNTVEVDFQRLHIEPMIGRLNILDIETGERRRTSITDVLAIGLVGMSAAEYFYF